MGKLTMQIYDETSARHFLEAKVRETYTAHADGLYLLPTDFEAVIRAGEGLIGWRPSVVVPDYVPLFRDRMGQMHRVRVGLNRPGAGRFTSLSACVALMGQA
jgi:hypothetical protein